MYANRVEPVSTADTAHPVAPDAFPATTSGACHASEIRDSRTSSPVSARI